MGQYLYGPDYFYKLVLNNIIRIESNYRPSIQETVNYSF